jgi:hypothetical protein
MSVGLVVATVFMLTTQSRSFAVVSSLIAIGVLGGAAAAIEVTRNRRSGRVALLVEQREPRCRNLIITADELVARDDAHGRIRTIVFERAAALVRTLDLAQLFPARNAVLTLGITTALWGLSLAVPQASRAVIRNRTLSPRGPSGVSIGEVVLHVRPPGYTGQQPRTLTDPARVEAIIGSRIDVTVRTDADRVIVETLSARDTLNRPGEFRTSVTADADGYIAIEPRSANGIAGGRRLIGLTVTPDAAPRVRIVTPGRDLFLRDAQQPIALSVEATDDIGLASLTLRFTKVSGSGERFTFTEGDVPLAIARTTGRAWAARATWRIDGLGLGPGDMLVYRAVATDHRPGGTPSESDAFIAEILAPGGEAAAGFAIDPEQERYAVSQQMVILKTERLAARRSQMSAEDVATASHDLSAEQRKVRAEFVFMMGGELASEADIENMTEINEEAEAEGEADILAGRLANQGRIAILRAIRSMSRASTALNTADLTTALTHERAALVQLERAFARTRIILRALTERERLDFGRRLTGALADATRSVRPSAQPELDTRIVALRQSLSTIASIAGAGQFDAAAASRASETAERVLRIDPSAKTLQEVATTLTSAADALASGRSTVARTALDRAASALAAALRSELPTAPARSRPSHLDRLQGALNDALRNPRGHR